MAIYAIGDIQGCDKSFNALLKKIKFKPNTDRLFLVGDLINRGPRSADVLQRILDHGNAISSVLGNHDITFLAIHAGFIKAKRKDTFDDLLKHQESSVFLNYLRHLPMLLNIQTEFKNLVFTHAGLYPTWSLEDAHRYSSEVEKILQTDTIEYFEFLKVLFGNVPNIWQETLLGFDRLRTLINCFTRMRFLNAQHQLDFQYKESLSLAPTHLKPWFDFERPKQKKLHLIYGHWAALGLHETHNTLCIDTGCIWNDRLTAVRIDTPQYEFFSVSNHD